MGLIPSFLLTSNRKLFKKKEFYFAVVLSLVLISPNLFWQYKHHFPVFVHLNELADTQLINVSRVTFLKEQLLFFSGGLLVLLASFFSLLFYPAFSKYRVFFLSFCFTIALFIFLKAKGYYAIGLYPVHLSFGSVYWESVLKEGWRKNFQPLLLLIPVLIFIPMYQWLFPNKSPEQIAEHEEKYKKLGLLRWEDGKDHLLPQDFADMLGWRELASKTDKIHSTLQEPGKTLFLCDNYGQAGAINYYTTRGIKAVTFNADYLNWFDLTQQYTHLVRVQSFQGRDEEFNELSQYFLTSSKEDSITNPYAREYRTIIFLFTYSKIDINQKIKEEMEEVNKRKRQNKIE